MRINFVNLNNEYSILKKDLHASLKKVASSGQFVFGNELSNFEKNISKLLKVKYVLGVGNWTEGMGLVCKALNLKKNQEIITVSNSFIATCGAIAYNHLKPVLIDVNDDLNMDYSLIEKKINSKTKAVMPVHLSGIPCAIDKIKKICKKHKLFFIEDAAHAFGGKYKNKYLGTLGDVGIFSLHPRKNFHVYGDGGLIVTNNKMIYQKLLLLRNHGLKNRDQASIWGTNSRLDNLQASFGNIMLKHIKKWNNYHLQIAKFYSKKLKEYVQTPIFDEKISKPTFHQYIIRTNKRDKLKKFLEQKGIQTAIHYPIPIHKQKAYLNSYGKIKLKKTETYSKKILSLPIYPGLSKSKLNLITNTIISFFKKNKK